MKPKTTELMKFQRLCRRLGESKRGVVGLLELLWNGTATNRPQGDIGHLPNEDIAIMCDWSGDPDDLVTALVEHGWLDASERHRLLVHDWPQHAPTYVHGNLKRWGKDFARDDAPIGTSTEDATSSPILPSPILPPPPPSSAAAEWEGVVVALHSVGMTRTQSAVKAARDSGCTPGAVMEVLEHFRASQPAWEPGALHNRITELRPGQNPTALWPPLSKAALQALTTEDRNAKGSAAVAEREAGQQTRESERQQRERLEAEWGPHLDAMSTAELRELFVDIWPNDNLPMRKYLPSRGKVTNQLLRQEMLSHVSNTPSPDPAE